MWRWGRDSQLRRAAERGDLHRLDTLLAAGARVDAADSSGWTALSHAANCGRCDCLRALLAAGAQVDAKNRCGQTALTYAAQRRDVGCLQALVAAGANPDAPTSDGTALIGAAKGGHVDCLEALLAAGAQVDAKDAIGWTALMRAAQHYDEHGRLDCIKTLLAAGAQLDARNYYCQAAFRSAAQEGHISCLKALLAAGAQVDAKGNHGWTALMCAAQHGHLDCLQALLAVGAQVDAKDPSGRAALSHAAQSDHVDVLEALLAAGAQVDAKSNTGQTALSYAPTSRIEMLLLDAATMPRRHLPGAPIHQPARSPAAGDPMPSAPTAPPSFYLSRIVDPPHAAVLVTTVTDPQPELRLQGAAPTTTGPPLQNSCIIPYTELQRGVLIGNGSFGQVYAATWKHTSVAVKEFGPAASALSIAQDALFLREVELLTKVNYPHVLRFYGYCPEPLCIVTERCLGGALFDVLQQARADEAVAKELTWPRRLGFALDAAKGMAYLHSLQPQILHRDLKSPNLLVTELWRVKVADLGLSKVASDVAATIAGGLSLGTDNPRWMAPEVLRSRRAASAASDVFSFGVVMWELLSWQLPWTHLGSDANNTAITLEVASGERLPVPASLPGSALHGPPGSWLQRYTALMQRCWAQAPAGRPAFAEIVAELERIGDEVQPGGLAQPAPPPAAAAPNPAAASLVCCICQELPPNAALLHRADKTQHRVCCMQCAEDLMARGLPCPICRRPIDDVFTSFG